jgi:PhnB protein
MTTAHNRASVEAQIRKVVEDATDAIRRKDAPAVVSHQAAGYVHFSLAPPLQSTQSDVKGLEAWFATWQGPIGFEVRDLKIVAGDDLAFCWSFNRLSGTKTDGARADVWFRATLCFRKIDGAWKLVHQHESVPFYMDGSLKAAVDLKP